MTLGDAIKQDLWIHIASSVIMLAGFADVWFFHGFSHDVQLMLIIGGAAGLGLKLVNGSASTVRTLARTATQLAEVAAALPPTVPPIPPTLLPTQDGPHAKP